MYAANVLSGEQVESFIERGYVAIPGCFSREQARARVEWADSIIGYDPKDPKTWEHDKIVLRNEEPWQLTDIRTYAPRAWQAVCQILGGEQRISLRPDFGGMIVNYRIDAESPRRGPGPWADGWHTDGIHRRYLDSPELGLLMIVIWQDIQPGGGGTWIAPDSVGHVARALHENRGGGLNFRKILEKCTQFEELNGEAGDVVLIHPFMLHSSSPNHSGIPRYATNPPTRLAEPMRFDREPAESHSAVEIAIKRAIQGDHWREPLPYAIGGPRENQFDPSSERGKPGFVFA